MSNMCFLLINRDNCTIQEAVNKVLYMMKEEYCRCLEAETRLPWSKEDEEFNESLRIFVHGCHMMPVGTAYWR